MILFRPFAPCTQAVRISLQPLHSGWRRVVALKTLLPHGFDVREQIVRGCSNKEIATALDISEATVKTHINSLLGKLGVPDRTQAATAAIQRGIVTLESLRKPKP